jgi:hypothetical protein
MTDATTSHDAPEPAPDPRDLGYDLRRPCTHCPFRTDPAGFLHPKRAREIVQDLQRGVAFACHNTAELDPDDDSVLVATNRSHFCAGAMIALIRQHGSPNWPMLLAQRLGRLDLSKLDMSAPVGDLNDFLATHSAQPSRPDTNARPAEPPVGD